MTDPQSGKASATSLPGLGHRGEGWVIGQFVWLALVFALGAPALARLGEPMDAARLLGVLAGGIGLLLGLGLAVLGVRDLGRQIKPWPRPPDDGHLVQTGVYRCIRHPIYAGAVLLGISYALLTGSLASGVAAIGLAAWMDMKARREEAWLLGKYPAYAAYRVRSWRFIPRVY